MPIRSLLLPILFACGSSLAAAQSSTAPHPSLPAPRYAGPIAANPHASAFAAPQPNISALLQSHPKVITLGTPSRKSTCYAIRSYAFTPSTDTIGVTHPTSESTCVAADTSSMKQAAQPSGGPPSQ